MARSPYTFKESPLSSHCRILEHFPAPGEGRRVLDVGCASGYLAAILADRGYQVTGLDRPGTGHDSFPAAVRLIEADLDLGLPPLDGPYYAILCADILEHLKDPAALLERLRRLLPPDGFLLASLPNSVNLYFRLVIFAGHFPKQERGLFDRTHLHFFTWDGWRGLFRRAGYRIETVTPTPIPFGLQFPGWQGSVAIRLAEAVCYGFARLRRQLFAYQFVTLARPASSRDD